MMPDEMTAIQNTDREIWREVEGDFYAPSIHVTAEGSIGINVAGHVIIKPVRNWHLQDARIAELDAANTGLATENERLKAGLRWYAHGNHFDLDGWEGGADPECPQWLEPPDAASNPSRCDLVEDGWLARRILSGQSVDWSEDGEPMEHPAEPCMQAIRIAELEAENKRLREACQAVDTHYSGSLDYQPPYVAKARAALSGEGPT